ncbi:GNAT family N-acetyltransferase [Oxalobacteraceae bacterium]|nr:GNAT family N-acetyltransferase [Oxalobacteraceae bacterium]
MNEFQLNHLIGQLWPQGDSLHGPQVYLLLDGARDRAIAPLVNRGKLESACLFANRVSPRLLAAAPYLVHLAAQSPQTRELLLRAWGNSWGMLVITPAAVTMEQLRLHFKKLLRVRTEQGRELLFRFYDPRVLRVYLPTCTDEERRRFLGPVSRIVIESADALCPQEFGMHLPAAGAMLAPLTMDAPAAGPVSGFAEPIVAAASDDLAVLQALPSVLDDEALGQPSPHGQAEALGDGRLSAAPLGVHHAQAYWELHRSSAVAALPLLPVLDSIDATRRWIRQGSGAGTAVRFALRHPDHGLVGGLALARRGDAALFGLWIGTPFQRRGYGVAAMLNLRQYALQEGIRRLYVAVPVSRSAQTGLFRRTGFKLSGETLEAPFDGMRIYEWCQSDAAPATLADMQALLRV